MQLCIFPWLKEMSTHQRAVFHSLIFSLERCRAAVTAKPSIFKSLSNLFFQQQKANKREQEHKIWLKEKSILSKKEIFAFLCPMKVTEYLLSRE